MTTIPQFPSPFTLTPLGDTTTVAITGELVTQNRQQLKQLVLDELARGQRHVVLDCTLCAYIDSAGLGVLVSLSKTIRDRGGSIEIHRLNDDLVTLFKLTKMDSLFTIRRAEP